MRDDLAGRRVLDVDGPSPSRPFVPFAASAPHRRHGLHVFPHLRCLTLCQGGRRTSARGRPADARSGSPCGFDGVSTCCSTTARHSCSLTRFGRRVPRRRARVHRRAGWTIRHAREGAPRPRCCRTPRRGPDSATARRPRPGTGRTPGCRRGRVGEVDVTGGVDRLAAQAGCSVSSIVSMPARLERPVAAVGRRAPDRVDHVHPLDDLRRRPCACRRATARPRW